MDILFFTLLTLSGLSFSFYALLRKKERTVQAAEVINGIVIDYFGKDDSTTSNTSSQLGGRSPAFGDAVVIEYTYKNKKQVVETPFVLHTYTIGESIAIKHIGYQHIVICQELEQQPRNSLFYVFVGIGILLLGTGILYLWIK